MAKPQKNRQLLVLTTTFCALLFAVGAIFHIARNLSVPTEPKTSKPLSDSVTTLDFGWEYRWNERNWQSGAPGVTPHDRDEATKLTYRTVLPEFTTNDLWIYLPPIIGHSKMSINGETLVQSNRFALPNTSQLLYEGKLARLPPSFSNGTLQIEVLSDSLLVGMRRIPEVGSKANLIVNLVKSELLRLCIAGVLLIVGFFYSARGTRKDYKDRNYLGIFYMVMSVYFFSVTEIKNILFNLGPYWQYIEISALVGCSPAYCMFLLHRFPERFSKATTYALAATGFIAAGLIFCMFLFQMSAFEIYPWIGVIFVAGGLVIAWNTVPVLTKGDFNSLLFGVGTTFAMAVSWIDAAAILGLIPWQGHVTVYAMAIMVLCYDLIIGNKLVGNEEVVRPILLEMPQSKWSLKFDPYFEDQFKKRYVNDNLATIRTPSLVNIVAFIVSGFVVKIWFTENLNYLAYMGLSVFVIIGGVYVALTYHKHYWKFHESTFVVGLLSLHTVLGFAYQEIPQNFALAASPAVFIAIITNSVAQFLRTKANCVATLGCMGIWITAFLASGVYPNAHGKPVLMLAMMFLSTALAIVISRSIEVSQRRNFVLEQSLIVEEKRANELMENIIPRDVAIKLGEDRTGQNRDAIGMEHSTVSVLFADLVGFTSWSNTQSAHNVAQTMHEIFSTFDDICTSVGVEKIKTIGDSYMAAAGVPNSDPQHAQKILDLGFSMLDAMSRLNKNLGTDFALRIGIHTGSLTSGVIGKKKFAYDIWGDTVNVASRMESTGSPGKIQISDQTLSFLDTSRLVLEQREVQVKGKGKMSTSFVEQPSRKAA